MSTDTMWLTILASLTLAGCDAHTSRGERNPVESDVRLAEHESAVRQAVASPDEVRRILTLRARQMITALNELGMRSVDPSAVRVLTAAWQGVRSSEPNVNWEEMDRSDVRFALASELVRAHVNGIPDVPIDSIAEFGRTYLTSESDDTTLNRAIYLVVLAGKGADMERVKETLLAGSSQTTFRAGVSALASVCSAEAAAAIEDIRRDSTDKIRKDILDDVVEKAAPFRARHCATPQNEAPR